jgi:hypothetical protein
MLVASIMPAVAGAFLGVLGLIGGFVGHRRTGRARAYLMSQREREADFQRPRNEWDLL